MALRFSHVALPSYATDCEPWECTDGLWTRLFTVQEWQIGAVLIAVAGEQTSRGKVMHWLYVGGEDQFFGPSHRAVLEALVEADDLLRSLG